MKLLKPNTLYQNVMKVQCAVRGPLLGLDVGEKHVGLAISDRSLELARPLSVLARNNQNIGLIAGNLRDLITKHGLSGFVIGCPYDRLTLMNNPDAIQVKVFVSALCDSGKLNDVPYVLWEENFTTKCVERMLNPLKLNPIDHKRMSDKFAAVGILQDYLDCINDESES